MTVSALKDKAVTLKGDVRRYWRTPPEGRYMTFKEIAAYAFGGIGAYFLITVGSTLLVGTMNMIVSGAIGIAPSDCYVLYLIATLANIPLTALRAQMVDNARGKGGKYRPYLLSMGIPTAVISIAYVWFPYDKLYDMFPNPVFSKPGGYVAKCAVVLVFNLLLQFFYWFFNDAYTNLIHVLSPNTQERTDVLAVKSIVYSLAPSIMNFVIPLVAQYVADSNLYDIRVYRISYPVFSIIGVSLTVIVFANTKEKIVQAKTHTIQIGFVDAFKEVSKNKYFWIIALAGWLGFLELAYQNILGWSCTYGHTCNSGTLSIINTLNGNAALWGMLLAPFVIRKLGKKKTLISMNALNILFILLMLVRMDNIWWIFGCIYLNSVVSAFEQITSPAIQADIRDYQQYRSGERIDGMFATVSTIGNLVTLLTSSVLPAVETRFGIYQGNGYEQPRDIMDVTTGEPGLFYKMLTALILMAALGAALNLIPYFFYDFTEKKQKCIVHVLKVRALFEDYGNHALHDAQIVEAIELVEDARAKAEMQPRPIDKAAGRKQRRDDRDYNDEIEISQFVCKELNKFDTPLGRHQVEVCSAFFALGLDGIRDTDLNEAYRELAAARALPKETEDEKALRTFDLEFIQKRIAAKKAYDRYYSDGKADFVEPDMKALTDLFDKEDALDAKIFDAAQAQNEARKNRQSAQAAMGKETVRRLQEEKKQVQKDAKALMDAFARFNRAAKPYNDAKRLLMQKENYSHFEEIAAMYETAKANVAASEQTDLSPADETT